MMINLIDRIHEYQDWIAESKENVIDLSTSANYLAEEIKNKRKTPIVIVDFSELHRYLYPWRGQYKGHFGFWKNPNKRRLAINTFFDRSSYYKVFIPEYFHEFRNHLSTLIDLRDYLGDKVNDFVKAKDKDIITAVKTEKIDARIKLEFEKLFKISNKIKNSRPDSYKERGDLIGIEKEILPILRKIHEDVMLLACMQSSLQIHSIALQIFDKLREDNVLHTTEEVLKKFIPDRDVKISDSDPVYLDVYGFLRDHRPYGWSQNRADAKAVATQVKLQHIIGKERSVVVFSDSTLMHQLTRYSKDVLSENSNYLRIHGISFFAHAFSYMGRTGISVQRDIDKNFSYFQRWSEIGQQFESIQGDLGSIERTLKTSANQIEKFMEVNDIFKKTESCIEQVKQQINRLEQEDILEAEIETRSSEIWQNFQMGKLGTRFGTNVQKILSTLVDMEKIVLREDIELTKKYYTLSDELARRISRAAEQINTLFKEIRNIQEAIYRQLKGGTSFDNSIT